MSGVDDNGDAFQRLVGRGRDLRLLLAVEHQILAVIGDIVAPEGHTVLGGHCELDNAVRGHSGGQGELAAVRCGQGAVLDVVEIQHQFVVGKIGMPESSGSAGDYEFIALIHLYSIGCADGGINGEVLAFQQGDSFLADRTA